MPAGALGNPWLWLLGLLITSGFLQYAVGAIRDYAKKRAEAPVPPTEADKFVDRSLLAMSKANAQLEDDNERLRQTNRELTETLSAERAERTAERAALMREIEALQARLRDMSVEVAELARKIGARQAHDSNPNMRTVGPGFSRTPPIPDNDPYHPMDHSQGPGDRAEKTYEIRED